MSGETPAYAAYKEYRGSEQPSPRVPVTRFEPPAPAPLTGNGVAMPGKATRRMPSGPSLCREKEPRSLKGCRRMIARTRSLRDASPALR